MLTAAIIGIIDVVLDLTDVTTFLNQPLARNTTKQALKNLTTPGKILWSLDFLDSTELDGDVDEPSPSYDFNDQLLDSGITKPWESDPLQWVLNALITLSDVQYEQITLFDTDGSFPFKIDLYQDGDGIVGLQLEPTGSFEIGGDSIAIEFYVQNDDDVSEWTPSSITTSGLSVGFYNANTSEIHLRVSLAGLGIRIRRRDNLLLFMTMISTTLILSNLVFDWI